MEGLKEANEMTLKNEIESLVENKAQENQQEEGGQKGLAEAKIEESENKDQA